MNTLARTGGGDAPSRLSIRLLGLAAAAAVAFCGPAVADPIPQGWLAKNVEPVGYSDLDGRAAPFKLAIKKAADGRWYLFAGHFSDWGYSIVDVTDPTDPRVVRYLEGPRYSSPGQVTIHGDILITNVSVRKTAAWPRGSELEQAQSVTPREDDPPESELPEGGVMIWDISDPPNPRLLSHWKANGVGTHRNSYQGGRYAYLASTKPGYRNEVLLILDVSDPTNPHEVGYFAQEGQRESDPRPATGVPGYHGVPEISPDGTMAAIAYAPEFINLDISDPSDPKVIGRLQFSPPFPDFGATSMHHALALWDRNLVIVASEQLRETCEGMPLHHQSIIDNSDPTRPRLMATFPVPIPSPEEGIADYCDKGGRFGPHNLNQETHSPDVEKPGNLIYTTWFNAGLRIHDISNPRLPTEVGWYVPPTPTKRIGWLPSGSLVSSTEDVLVDARGYIYTTDRQWGLHILRYTGEGQPAPTAQ